MIAILSHLTLYHILCQKRATPPFFDLSRLEFLLLKHRLDWLKMRCNIYSNSYITVFGTKRGDGRSV